MKFSVHRFHLRRKRAVVLILVLWLSMILAMMAYSVAYELRLNLRLSRQSQDLLKTRALARAGLARAVIDLKNDQLLKVADMKVFNSDSYRDVWATTEDKTHIEYGGGHYTLRIEDEEGKLNLRLLNAQNLPVLQHVFRRVLGWDLMEAQVMSQMVLDWQDRDLLAVAGTVGSSHEIDFYTEWAYKNFAERLPDGWRFQPKNDFMMSLEELTAIPIFTREMIFGDPEDEIDLEKDDLIERRANSTRLADYLTVGYSRWVNINTISNVVLEGLLIIALDSAPAAEGMALKIDEYRLSLMRVRGAGGSIININQLQEVGMERTAIGKMMAILPVNVSSNYYKVISEAHYRGLTKRLEVLVRVDRDSHPIDPNDPETFGRRDRRASGSLTSREFDIIDPSVRVIEYRDM